MSNWGPPDIVADCAQQLDAYHTQRGDNARETVDLLREAADDLERRHVWPEGPWNDPRAGDVITGETTRLRVTEVLADVVHYVDQREREQAVALNTWRRTCSAAAQWSGMTYTRAADGSIPSEEQ